MTDDEEEAAEWKRSYLECQALVYARQLITKENAQVIIEILTSHPADAAVARYRDYRDAINDAEHGFHEALRLKKEGNA